MAALAYSEIEGYWVAAGGDPAVAPIAAAITFPESGGDPSTVQKGQPYATTGWGLWQITPGNSEPQCGVDQALLQPGANACAAVAKWKSAGGFSPWTTYTGGQYRQYLKAGITPAQGPPASDAGAFGIGAFGSTVAGGIQGATHDATNTALGVAVAALGLVVLGAVLWLMVKDTGAGRVIAGTARAGALAVLHV